MPQQPPIPGPDLSVQAVGINGQRIDDLTSFAIGTVTDDGRVIDLEHRGLVALGDGMVTDRVEGTRPCDVCAAEAAACVAAGAMTALRAMPLTRHSATLIARSSISGVLLCPRHQRPVHTPGGMMIVSPTEAETIERQLRRARWWRWLVNCFVEPPRGPL